MTESERLPRMLFLDDRTKRIESARKQYEGKYELTIVTNAKECLRYLCREEFDIVSLDHDLDGNDFQDPDCVTSGMEVVRYIAKCGGFLTGTHIPEFWIHSSNLLAANLMSAYLLKADIPSYYRRFEYGDEKNFGDAKPSHKPEPVEDKWKWFHIDTCISCDIYTGCDKNKQCHECYKREMKQCG